jgi:hypothetical protein
MTVSVSPVSAHARSTAPYNSWRFVAFALPHTHADATEKEGRYCSPQDPGG